MGNYCVKSKSNATIPKGQSSDYQSTAAKSNAVTLGDSEPNNNCVRRREIPAEFLDLTPDKLTDAEDDQNEAPDLEEEEEDDDDDNIETQALTNGQNKKDIEHLRHAYESRAM